MASVVVIWKDSTNGRPGWHTKLEWQEFVSEKEAACISYGTIIFQDEAWLTLAQTNSGETVNGLLKIYIPMILEIIDIPDLDVLRGIQKGSKKTAKKRTK